MIPTITVEKADQKAVINASDLPAWQANGWAVPAPKDPPKDPPKEPSKK